MAVTDILEQLGGPRARADVTPPWLIVDVSDDHTRRTAYLELRRREFVDRQELFTGHDHDHADVDPHTRVLMAVTDDGEVVGGVRVHPDGDDPDLGWWRGSRLVVDAGAPRPRGRIGAALVVAACACALDVGALRFDADVQLEQVAFFVRLGWTPVREISIAGSPHMRMRWSIDRCAELAQSTKAPLGELLAGMLPTDRWLGDDGVPVPHSDIVTSVDAITPSMVDRDPEWAGWCAMLVTAHDLAAMGAEPVGALDALGALNRDHAERVLTGVRHGAQAFSLPILGGHTQLGVPAALSVTGLGRTNAPVAAGAGRIGDALTLTADLAGSWRPGYHGRQWDSTSWRSREELAPMLGAVREAQPHAAKDVSMAGIVGTAGMLAEASGCGVEFDLTAILRPRAAGMADWLTCFPGFAVLTADRPGTPPLRAGEARSRVCGTLTAEPGVRLRWPDGDITTALTGAAVSGLGRAQPKMS